MRDISKLTDDDIPSMTLEEEAAYYEANAHRINEIFDGEPATFIFDPDYTMTTRIVPMTLREARIYDSKLAYARR